VVDRVLLVSDGSLSMGAQDKLGSERALGPGHRVSVDGHTDATGPEAYNQGLSERRARAVRDYLVSKGVPGARLQAVGYGEANPIASNATREGRALNRRVELRMMK
jgi:OOP family OmpA-OmpF porin